MHHFPEYVDALIGRARACNPALAVPEVVAIAGAILRLGGVSSDVAAVAEALQYEMNGGLALYAYGPAIDAGHGSAQARARAVLAERTNCPAQGVDNRYKFLVS